MSGWRRAIGAIVLAVTVLTLPSPAIRCACASRMAAGAAASMAGAAGRCSRCHAAPAPSAGAQLSCALCCSAKLVTASAAVTPATLQLDRLEVVSAAALAPLPRAISDLSIEGASRAPPDVALRSGSPPGSYRSILRL